MDNKSNTGSAEINVQLTDRQIDELLEPKKDRIAVISAGPIVFDLSPVDLLNKKVKVTVLLLGIPVGEIILDADSVSQSIGPNIGIAKASITLTANWENKVVTYIAKACMRNWKMKWKCADYNGTITKW